MPKKPRVDHPVRQVRTCLGHTQVSFARLVGCSGIAIQRIENGTLPLSAKLANIIAEATGADPATLRTGTGTQALDRMGKTYSKDSLDFLKSVLPMTDQELSYYRHTLVGYLELLLIASNRGGKFKTYAVNAAVQDALQSIAEQLHLVPSIHSFLIEQGHFYKHKYRVSDLRKFPDYARILGFKDDKRYRPDKLIEFTIPRGWIQNYQLGIVPVLPHGAARKLRDAEYMLDFDRPIPPEIKEVLDQAEYWEIKSFELVGTDAPR